MRIIFWFLLLSISINKVSAQEAENALSAVHYTFTYLIDTSKPNQLYREEMILFIGKKSSSYVSFEKSVQSSLFQSNLPAFENYTYNNPDLMSKRTIQTVFFRYDMEKKFFILENELKDYVMEDSVSIQWAIMDSLKNIGGFECKKATGQFRGRVYDVWFTSSISSNSGPWKLGGLPGLIIEAHDSRNQVNFSFAGNENLGNREYVIGLPKNAIQISKMKFKKIKEEIENDPIAYFNRTSGAQINPSALQIPTRAIRKPNNPIELKEY